MIHPRSISSGIFVDVLKQNDKLKKKNNRRATMTRLLDCYNSFARHKQTRLRFNIFLSGRTICAVQLAAASSNLIWKGFYFKI